MNILHHKSWHVRNKDNIERVRRDEAKAAEEEKEKERKIALAEQEARTELLRNKNRKRTLHHEESGKELHHEESGQEKALVVQEKPQHINFFEELEQGKPMSKSNKDYEEEKRLEKEKYEKDIGLLTYLGQSATELQETKPWYFKAPESKKRKKESEEEFSKIEETHAKIKTGMDPMRQMSKYMELKSKHKEKKHKSEHRHKKEKKHKHKEKPRTSSGSKSIEQLRAERLQREKEERAKTEKLLASRRGETVDKPETVISERDRGYNSQYNPSLARLPKRRKDHHYH